MGSKDNQRMPLFFCGCCTAPSITPIYVDVVVHAPRRPLRPALAALRRRGGPLRALPPRRLAGPVPLRLALPRPDLPRLRLHLHARLQEPAPALRRPGALGAGPRAADRARLAAALRVPHLRLEGGRRDAAPLPARALPPEEPLHPAPGRGGARLGPRGAGGVRGGPPGPRRGAQRAGGGEGEPGHLPRPHHGDHHAARCRRVPLGRGPGPRRRLGLVHQPLRLRLPARHAGRYDGGVLGAAARPQLPRPHQRHRLESVCEGDAGDHRPGALHEEEGRSLLDTSEAGAAHRLQTLHRFCVDGAIQAVRGVPDLGVGQPPAHGAHVLRQLHLVPGGLLPHRGLQRRRVPQHHRQPRPPLHRLGQPPHAAPAPAHPRRLGRHARQRRPLRPQVPPGRPRPRQDRRRPPLAGPRHARPGRLVRRGAAGCRCKPHRRRQPVRGCWERHVRAPWPGGCAAEAARYVAPVRGELPAETVQSSIRRAYSRKKSRRTSLKRWSQSILSGWHFSVDLGISGPGRVLKSPASKSQARARPAARQKGYFAY